MFDNVFQETAKMQRAVVKYSIVIFFLLVYINRGLFISATYEVENKDGNEVNSVIEWVSQLITGEDNGIDEDGDLQSDCNSVKVVSYNYYQEFAKYFDSLNLYSKSLKKTAYPNNKNILQIGFYTQIDHPPQV